MWLNHCATFGIEGEFFALADENTDYDMWSDGNPIISRPFYDVGRTNPIENVELVAFPRGSRTVSTARSTSVRRPASTAPGRTSSSPPADRKAAGPTTAPARPTTTASAPTLSPAIDTWTWRTNSASRKPSRHDVPCRSIPRIRPRPGRHRLPDQRSVQYAEHLQRGRSGHEVRVPAESLVVGRVPTHRLGLHALGGRYQRLDADHQPLGSGNDFRRRPAGPAHEHRPLHAGQLRRRARNRLEARLPVHAATPGLSSATTACIGARWLGRASRSIER